MADIDLTAVKDKVQKKDCSLIDVEALTKTVSLLFSNEKLDKEIDFIPVYTLNEKCNELSSDFGINFVNEDNSELEENENKVLRTEFANDLYNFYNKIIEGEEYYKIMLRERLTKLSPDDPYVIGMAKSFLLSEIAGKPIIELMKEGSEFHNFIPSISGLPLFGRQIDTETVFNTNIYYTDNGDFYLCNAKGEGYNCSESLEKIYKVLVGQYDNEGNLSNDSFKYNQKANKISSTKGDISVLLSNFYIKFLNAIDYNLDNLSMERLEDISKKVGVNVDDFRIILHRSVNLFHILIRYLAIFGYTPNYTYAYTYFAKYSNSTVNDFSKQSIILDGYCDRVCTGLLWRKIGVNRELPDGLYVDDVVRDNYFSKLSHHILRKKTYITFNASQIINRYNHMLTCYVYGSSSDENEDVLGIPLSERIGNLVMRDTDVEDFDRKIKDYEYPIEMLAGEISRSCFNSLLDAIILYGGYKGEWEFLNKLSKRFREEGEGSLDVVLKEQLKLIISYATKKRMEYPGELGPKLRFTDELQKVMAEGISCDDKHLPYDIEKFLPDYESIARFIMLMHNWLYDGIEPRCGLKANDPIIKSRKESWDNFIEALKLRRNYYKNLEEKMKTNNETMRKEISNNIAKIKDIETETIKNLEALAEKANVKLDEKEDLKQIVTSIEVKNNVEIVSDDILDINVEEIADDDLAEIHENVAKSLKSYDKLIKSKVKEFEAEFVKSEEITKDELKKMKSEIKKEAKEKEESSKKDSSKEKESKSESSSSKDKKDDDDEKSYFEKLGDVVFCKETAIVAGIGAVAYFGYKALKGNKDDEDKRGENGEVFLNGEEGFTSISDYNLLASKFSSTASKETSKVVSSKITSVASEGIVSKIAGFFTGSFLLKK